MTNSIDGLVRVAQQSIKTQAIDILYWQREVLESTMKEFDETILNIELKIVDADEHHVAIYEKALSKKQTELQAKKTELEEIRSAIKEKEEETTSSSQVLFNGPNNDEVSFSSITQSMPHTTPIGNSLDVIGCCLCMSCSITCHNMIVLGIEPSWLALSLSCCTLVVAPLLPPLTSLKCLPPPTKPTGDMSSGESPTGTYVKSINVSTSCLYLAGPFALPLSTQKLCK